MMVGGGGGGGGAALHFPNVGTEPRTSEAPVDCANMLTADINTH